MSCAKTILCAGIAVQDIVMRVERFPQPGQKVPASEFVITGGGCAANAAVAVARLGGRVEFSGPLGGPPGYDAASDQIIADLEREGIGCGGVARVPGGTASVSLILLDADGEKSIATRRGKNLLDATPSDAAALVATVDAVLIDNRFPKFVAPICAAARARGIPVVIDGDQETTEDDALLALGTHVVFSAECLCGTTQQTDVQDGLRRMSKHLRSFLAVTDGANGAYWIDNGALRHVPGFPITAVDTLGAGDVFHGAFTLALLEGQAMPAAIRFACAAAAIKCTRFGGTTGAPTRAEVEALLSGRSL